MFFHNKIIVHPLPDGNNWITEDWTAVTLDDNRLIFIPKGFKTDFGSIAKIMWAIVGAPATGRHRRGVLYHDWIYGSQQCSRKEADEICRDIMKFDNTNIIKRTLIYYGVRIGGWVAWNRKEPASKALYVYKQVTQFTKNSISHRHNIYA